MWNEVQDGILGVGRLMQIIVKRIWSVILIIIFIPELLSQFEVTVSDFLFSTTKISVLMRW
jgi:hypothetical protein